jgi:hypothetical protein
VSCAGLGSCVAAGAYFLSNQQPLIETLNLGTWSPTSPPLPAGADGGSLFAVSCPVSSCTAVGNYFTPAGSGAMVETEPVKPFETRVQDFF